jgi:hypothetical protein
MGERTVAYRAFVDKLERRGRLGRPRYRRRNNIKIDLREVEWGHGLDRSVSRYVRWRAVVNAVINLQVP